MNNICQLEGQISIFDYIEALKEAPTVTFDPLNEFLKNLNHLGTCVGSKERIINLFKRTPDKKERTDILKKEYGIGGFGGYRFAPVGTYSICGANYDAKGIEVEYYEPWKMRGDVTTKKYSYTEVAEAISQNIDNGLYTDV